MKTISSNKDNNYSLNNIENYKKELNYDIGEIVKKYSELIIEYIKFIIENIKINNKGFSNFVLIRGLDTITNVFNYILYFTKNLELTYYHCQKSFYFYVEFVGQISEDEKMFLQLTSRDATTYVYKKTIFEINNEFKKINENITNDFIDKLDTISNYIKLYQIYLLKIIQTDKIEVDNLEYLIKITEKIYKKPYFLSSPKIIILEKINEKMYNTISDIDKFFEINYLILKNTLKTPEIFEKLEKKINLEEFDEKINNPSNKFVNWLIV